MKWFLALIFLCLAAVGAWVAVLLLAWAVLSIVGLISAQAEAHSYYDFEPYGDASLYGISHHQADRA